MLYLVLDTSVRFSFQYPDTPCFTVSSLYKQDRRPNRAGGPILIIRGGIPARMQILIWSASSQPERRHRPDQRTQPQQQR